MEVVQFVREGLGNSSYLVEIGRGEAVLVDPDRMVDRYFEAAAKRRWKVAGVFETHVHADFVSGACEAISRTDLRLFLPRDGGYRYRHDSVGAGQTLNLATTGIEAIASPGHTPEHLSYAFREGGENEGAEPVLFSGGALIVGGAARTDLIAPEETVPLTRALYRTIRTAFSALPDDTRLMPTHGGGSFCSVGTGPERTSTLGLERQSNPLLQFDAEDEFVDWFPRTFPSAPAYYFRMRSVNQSCPGPVSQIPAPSPMAPEDYARRAGQGAWIVDARPFRDYAAAHIRGSISIEYRDGFGVWVGALVPPESDLLFVPGDVSVDRLVEECLLVGYERFGGYLDGGIEAWVSARLPVARTGVATSAELRGLVDAGMKVLDVREADERRAGLYADATHVPVIQLPQRMEEVDRTRPILAHCAHGPRAASAASLLERAGYNSVRIMAGGMSSWRKAGFELDAG